jgi:hypothetical protein
MDKIKNIYLLNTADHLKLFIYSEVNDKDPLRYNYYILSIRKNAKPIVFESSRILQALKDNKSKIIKISPDDELHNTFNIALKNAKKIKLEEDQELKSIKYIKDNYQSKMNK